MCAFLIITDVWPNRDFKPQLGRVVFWVHESNTVFVAHEHGRCIEDVFNELLTASYRSREPPRSQRSAQGTPREQHRATREPKGNQRKAKGNQKGANGNQKEAKGRSQREPKGSQREPNGTRREPRMLTNQSQGDQIETPRLQNGSPKGPRKRKLEKVTNREASKVESYKKRIKDEGTQKLITPRRLITNEQNDSNSWLGHKKYCLPPEVFWKILIIRTNDSFSESQLYLRKKQQMKRKTFGEQQQPICGAHQTDARFLFDLENACISGGQTGSGKKRGPNNNHYSETILFNNNSKGDDPINLAHP